MGLTMQLGGVLTSSESARRAVQGLEEKHKEAFGSVGFYTKRDDRVLLFIDEHAYEAEQALADLSKRLESPVFYFLIYDEDFWMYRLYDNGVEVDRFLTCPGYWEEIDESIRQSWSGNAPKVCDVWKGVASTEIENYLIDHEAHEVAFGTKAYETDEFDIGDCWQLADFLSKLGIEYPDELEEE